MIYTPMTKKAMMTAYYAHHGQFDKDNIPYIFHPIHIAEQMEDEISCAAALLHDVVEDTDVTLDDLRRDFPEEVIRAVDLLTHREGVDYFDYVRALKADPVARKVKLADVAHNSDETRLADTQVTQPQLEYRRQKYAKAMAILTDADA